MALSKLMELSESNPSNHPRKSGLLPVLAMREATKRPSQIRRAFFVTSILRSDAAGAVFSTRRFHLLDAWSSLG